MTIIVKSVFQGLELLRTLLSKVYSVPHAWTQLSSAAKTFWGKKKMLTPDPIVAANKVAKELNVDDPGLVVQILDNTSLHTAMGFATSPVPQGGNPEQSANVFRDWLIASSQFVQGITPAHHVPTTTRTTAFHHLTEPKANAIVYDRWQ